MDQPKKLLATAARRDMGLIDLPDHIVHHILSYLAIEDLASLSVASTRCRELCRSVPSLMIDNKNVLGDRSEGFSNFVDRFLGLRFKLGPEMQRFCLHWSFKHGSPGDKYRLETWLYYAFYSNIEELDLEIIPHLNHIHFAFALPVSVLSCNSLRSLKVDMHRGIFNLPAFGFTALHTLRLKSVRIDQESFGEWVSTCCKSLRELSLQDLHGVKTISIISSSLVDFRMIYNPSDICHIKISAQNLRVLVMYWFPDSSSSKSLIVTAPNLTIFIWGGYLNHHYRAEKFLHLRQAALFLRPHPQLRENQDFTGLNLSEIVRSVSKARTLRLSGQLVEILFMRGCLPFSTDDLRKLVINVGGLNGTLLVPAIASLLKGMPALEFLAIMPPNNKNASPSNQVTNLSSSEEIGFSIEYWESQNLGFTDQLKTAVLTLCAGQNELELVKYLLKHATELKRMDLYYSPPLPSRISTELNNLKNSFPAVRLCNQLDKKSWNM